MATLMVHRSPRTSLARAVVGCVALTWFLAAAPARAGELAPEAARLFSLTEFHGDLASATATRFLPDGRAVITEKGGRVLVRAPSGETVVAGTLAVDADKEKGLLNVLVHPAFTKTRQLIFYYSAAGAPELDKHKISLIRLGEDDRLDLASEQVLVRGLRGPDDHEQGGGLAIDRLGRLLVGVGDTGCRARKLPEPPYEPANYFATCLTNGNGKILRVALDGSIPEDNPLTHVDAVTACGETCGADPRALPLAPPRRDIWAWGLRNPWRLWVDPRTGAVWTADVGDLANEEIDVIPEGGGKHYGWPWREGGQGHPVEACRSTAPSAGDCVDPAYFCRHDDAPGVADAGCKSINGGLIVDDCRFPPEYRGKYLFADNANGRLWSLTPTADRLGIVPGSRQDLGQVEGFVVDLELGPDAALYATVMSIPPARSVVLRLAPRQVGSCGASAAPAPGAGAPPPTASLAPAGSRLRRVAPVVLALALLVALGAAVLESRRR